MNIYFPGNMTVRINSWTFDEWRELENKPDGAFVLNERYMVVELMTKLDEVREIVQEWVDKKGHDKCHYYPELFKRIAEILEISINPLDFELPPRPEFRKMCGKYEEELYDQC